MIVKKVDVGVKVMAVVMVMTIVNVFITKWIGEDKCPQLWAPDTCN